jgi:hypothetical protein
VDVAFAVNRYGAIIPVFDVVIVLPFFAPQ